ncbi:MAG: integrase core domain-containing protein [Dehalococcoidales bacterium]|nr:integrase core domain-containing protein [Dehalococcoidales bacterium]
MPFKVKAMQVDGGSEFKALFERECHRRGIPLFVLPPKSPKLNGHVERAHRTHTEEFYEVHEIDWRVGELNKQLREWEKTYNEIRPHQSLGYLTPMEWGSAKIRQIGIRKTSRLENIQTARLPYGIKQIIPQKHKVVLKQ